MNSDEENGKEIFHFKTSSENDAKSLQEMIVEALMMSPNSDHSGEISGSFHAPAALSDDTEPANSSFFNGTQESLIIGRLLLQYKNLDLRLTQVEEIVYKSPKSDTTNASVRNKNRSAGTGLKRTRNANQNIIGHKTFTNTQSDNEIDTQSNSINPILTTSSAFLSYPLSSAITTSMTSSANSLPSTISLRRYAAKRKDDIKRCDLDNFCLPVLMNHSKPTNQELQALSASIEPIFPNVSQKEILSKIREWFRKRREYMSQRIFQACAEFYNGIMITNEIDLATKLRELHDDPHILEEILSKSDLEITDHQTAREYCQEKIQSFLNSAYRSSFKDRTLSN